MMKNDGDCKDNDDPLEILVLESLGNTTATSVNTCSFTIAFLLEDKGDHKL